MTNFDIDPEAKIEDLLMRIKAGAIQGASSPRTSVFAIAPFAALLVKLSDQADRTARKIVLLTWGLIFLTIALLAFTALLAWEGSTHEERQGAKLKDDNHPKAAIADQRN